MATITATMHTVTVEDQQIVGGPVKKRQNRVKIVTPSGEVPSGGMPMPAYAALGLRRNLEYLILSDQDDGSGLLWKYDQANNKLRAYHQTPTSSISPRDLIELATTIAVPASTKYAVAVGW